MLAGLEPVFKKYERFVKQLDDVFEQVRQKHPDCVKCKLECADCCHALFDLSLIEALYVNRHFIARASEEKKVEILDVANRTDRKIYQLKRKAFKSVDSGEKTEADVLLEMSVERVRCPLLNKNDRCELYEYRPITCRLYGIPTSIGGRGHTCGLSDFKEGSSYPTVNLDSVHAKLHELSQEVVSVLQSTHVKMGDMLMPLSMALLTVFDEAYLGIPSEKTDADSEKG